AEWNMNELNQTTYSKQPPFSRSELIEYINNGYSKSTPSLKEWQLTDSWLILCCNWLARTIMAPWLVNSYQHYFKIAQRAFSLTDKKMNLGISEAINDCSVQLKDSPLFVPAVSFFQQKSPTNYPEWLTAAPKKPVKRDLKYAKSASELKGKAELLSVQNFLRELKSKPGNFKNANQLIRQVMELCINKLGFTRSSLLVVDWSNKQVSTSLFINQTDSPKIKPNFSFTENTPLKKFLVEQGFLMFDLTKHQKIWHKLPKEIIEQQVKNFVLFSLKPKSKVEFLIYLDGKGKTTISEDKLKIVKLLLLTTNKVMSYNMTKR
ncbi:MAG: hypothetical protein KUG78_07130, partial [Kangiellaceae bacterium]|nr:hypothetical protein [Kangiellaceae bacterium]